MEYIVAAVCGLIGVIAGSLITNVAQRAKVQAEADKDDAAATEQIRQTCLGLIKPLQDQINELKIELQDWKDCADARAAQLRRHDIVPVAFRSSKKSDANIT